MAHFTQASSTAIYPNYGRGGRNGRATSRGGGNNGGGGRFQGARPRCQLCGKLGHTAYLTGPYTVVDYTWYVDSGVSHHVTVEHANIRQHSESSHTPEQLYVGNGKRVTRDKLLQGKAKGGIYYFDTLRIPRNYPLNDTCQLPNFHFQHDSVSPITNTCTMVGFKKPFTDTSSSDINNRFVFSSQQFLHSSIPDLVINSLCDSVSIA
ncbi:hypothetical protein PIB30_005904 [Stylosanthes scabra]|uniref:Uncharacterized protein n=1 Tax=Stylosanthes scabra TaxID=79078 RepID=A0ABU6R303_9FABA|nr:hypothetical protein [Stylosanthes scabra]